MGADEVRIPIASDADIVIARRHGRELASRAGFTGADPTLVATAISELARNIVVYAGLGELVLSMVERGGGKGISIVARDEGPGIADIDRALKDGYSTGRSLGLGLPGTRRLVDEFLIESAQGRGTTVTATKWVR